MRTLLMLGVFLIPAAGYSAKYGLPSGYDAFCLCQYGNSTAFEMYMYRRGCSVWFAQNDCGNTAVISIDEPLASAIPETFSGKINVGYVGHWNSSDQFLDFLQTQILPIVQQRRFESLLVDNTGCRAMAEPQLVQAYVNMFLQPLRKNVEVRGNETVSIGLWDSFYFGKGNLTAKVTADGKLHLPECEEYIDATCPFPEYRGEKLQGQCQMKSGAIKWIGCVQRTVQRNFGRGDIRTLTIDEWKEIERD